MKVRTSESLIRLTVRSVLGLSLIIPVFGIIGCRSDATSTPSRPVIGICFETLQTEFWVAGLKALKDACAANGYDTIESVANGDANRQLQHTKNMVTRGVAGIILVPIDGRSCGPMIRVANSAKIPIVLFNRPAEVEHVHFVAVTAENEQLSKETTEYLIQQIEATRKSVKAMVLVGDLGDQNAIERRNGFLAAIAQPANEQRPQIDVVAEVPTEWNLEKARAGVTNALQAHPDIGLIFCSSDCLLPGIVSALQSAGKYYPTGDPRHVLLGGFDGDTTAYQLLKEGYLDATGVQNVFLEAELAVQAITDQRAGKDVPNRLADPGFVIHSGNLAARSKEMWGATVAP